MKTSEAFPVCLKVGASIEREILEVFLKERIESLGSWGERRSECVGVKTVFQDKPEEAELLAGIPAVLEKIASASEPGVSVKRTIILLPEGKNVWDRDLITVLKSPVFDIQGIFRMERLLTGEKRSDPEDLFRLEDVLKEAIRSWLGRCGKGEREFSKPVDWKASLDAHLSESGYVSLFADPSTRRMALEVKEAIHSLKSRAEAIQKSAEKLPLSETNFKEMANKGWSVFAGRIPSVLLLGESGSGKTLLAKWIGESLLPKQFERVNISAIQSSLVDGELFGAAKGAFTDHPFDTKGLFLSQAGGVVFLDEIGDMEPACQTRLLTFIDDGLVRPLGWHGQPFAAPLLLVAATNRPLKEWVSSKSASFREDLFYRFDHVIELPPLRERRGDLRLLISVTLQDEDVNAGYAQGKGVRRISLDAIEALERMEMPGNFRELRGVLKRACFAARREKAETLCLRHFA